MQKVVTDPVVEGALEELLHECKVGHADSIIEALGGKAHPKPQFRIPAADVKTELFFDHRELLSRFANIPLPTQEDFLRAVRATMERNNVTVLRLSVQWSANKIRMLKFEAPTGLNEQLDIDLI